jgi:membrane-anchored glycerophosphoryl diester phosphodiesterase (GDPDase)
MLFQVVVQSSLRKIKNQLHKWTHLEEAVEKDKHSTDKSGLILILFIIGAVIAVIFFSGMPER